MQITAKSSPSGRSETAVTASSPWMGPPLGLTGKIVPWYPASRRLATTLWPTLPGALDAPMTAMACGSKSALNVISGIATFFFAGNGMNRDLETLQKVISHRFSQVKLLKTALTHSSFANEREEAGDNERLEFLGDAVLELCISEALYEKFPDAPEGRMTRMRAKLVSEPGLAAVARELKLDELLYLGKGEEMQGGRDRDSLLSDAMEAVLGAVFLDGGFDAARQAVRSVFGSRIPTACDVRRVKDCKSRLQELTQQRFRERPVYSLKDSHGPEHAKVFEVEVTLPDGSTLSATGQSLKKAEQNAAGKALDFLEK